MGLTSTERPILFSGEMVRAIIAGRKTQTRRIIKPQPEQTEGGFLFNGRYDSERLFVTLRCRHGRVGDRLWVREAFAVQPQLWAQNHGPQPIHYLADSSRREIEDYVGKPSIHMPRWASRITLEIEDVRVERVQDIGKDGRAAKDVLAEGVTAAQIEQWRTWLHLDDAPAHAFGVLWDSINKARGFGWDVNPWVWVVCFRRLP